jgi:hypothetical protein
MLLSCNHGTKCHSKHKKGEIVPQFWVNVIPSFENKPSHKMDWAIIAVLVYQHAHQVGQ